MILIADEEVHIKGRGMGIKVSLKKNNLPPLEAGKEREWLYREIEYNGSKYKVVAIETHKLAPGNIMDGIGLMLKPI